MNDAGKKLYRDLLTDFVDWCRSETCEMEPSTLGQLDGLINRFPLIKKSGWWPMPQHRLIGPRREAVQAVISEYIERMERRAA